MTASNDDIGQWFRRKRAPPANQNFVHQTNPYTYLYPGLSRGSKKKKTTNPTYCRYPGMKGF